MSSRKSIEATHSRTISPPMRSAMSTGSTPLPSDFDMARPCSSRVHPAVAQCEYGARPRSATDVSREEWNQPRCWSPPSRYSTFTAFILLEQAVRLLEVRIGFAYRVPARPRVEPHVQNVGLLAESCPAAVPRTSCSRAAASTHPWCATLRRLRARTDPRSCGSEPHP